MTEGNHSPRVLKSRQEVFDHYDRLMKELPSEQKNHTKSSYFIEQIAIKTGYSESHIKQLLRYRYKKK